MNVGELKELMKDAPDEMRVLLPADMDIFDGRFKEPCTCDSGVAQLGIMEGVDDVHSNDFLLVPHGFFEETTELTPRDQLLKDAVELIMKIGEFEEWYHESKMYDDVKAFIDRVKSNQ